jgi:hypothetical protein
MWPHYVTVDTLKVIKRLAYLNSNKLDYLGEYFGLGRKEKVDYQLWKDVVADRPGALDRMVRYNRRDVRMLADLYELIQPYMTAPNSVARTVADCPHCGSEHTIIRLRRKTAAGHSRIQLQCRDCGQYFTVAESRLIRALEG